MTPQTEFGAEMNEEAEAHIYTFSPPFPGPIPGTGSVEMYELCLKPV